MTIALAAIQVRIDLDGGIEVYAKRLGLDASFVYNVLEGYELPNGVMLLDAGQTKVRQYCDGKTKPL